MKATDDEPFDAKPLVTTLKANIQYLQEEYSTLLVKGRFDDSTAQLFRALQKGNSGFDTKAINNVRIAAELTSIQPKAPFRQPSNFRPPGYTPRYSPRYNTGYSPRYQGSGRGYTSDVFSNVQGSRYRNPGPRWGGEY